MQPHHWSAYTKERYICNLQIIYYKCQAITKTILDCTNNSKQLLSMVITNNKLSNPLPENKSDEEIANDFETSSLKKYKKIEISLPM